MKISKDDFNSALIAAMKAACEQNLFPPGEVTIDEYERNYDQLKEVVKAAFESVNITVEKP